MNDIDCGNKSLAYLFFFNRMWRIDMYYIAIIRVIFFTLWEFWSRKLIGLSECKTMLYLQAHVTMFVYNQLFSACAAFRISCQCLSHTIFFLFFLLFSPFFLLLSISGLFIFVLICLPIFLISLWLAFSKRLSSLTFKRFNQNKCMFSIIIMRFRS